MESKKTLRRQAEKARGLANELSERLAKVSAGFDKLAELGYEPIEQEDEFWGDTETVWRLTEAQSAKNAARDAELAHQHSIDKADARKVGRHEALHTVLEALDIKGYGSPTRGYDVNRFLDDLQTALRVRSDIAAATERGKTEKKVADLLGKKEPLASGGLVSDYLPAATQRTSDDASAVRRNLSHFGGPITLSKESIAALKSAIGDFDITTAGEKIADAA